MILVPVVYPWTTVGAVRIENASSMCTISCSTIARRKYLLAKVVTSVVQPISIMAENTQKTSRLFCVSSPFVYYRLECLWPSRRDTSMDEPVLLLFLVVFHERVQTTLQPEMSFINFIMIHFVDFCLCLFVQRVRVASSLSVPLFFYLPTLPLVSLLLLLARNVRSVKQIYF